MNVSGTVVRATNVTKAYPVEGEGAEISQVALRGVSMTAAAGELVAVVGPSGSGKSTLMYCLAGLEAADSGEIQLLGTDMRTASARQIAIMRRRSLGFVFQNFNLVPSMTAGQNISLPLLLDGQRAGRRRQRTNAALHAVGLSDLEGRQPRRMSGGQQQRVALARVFAQSPAVVFADEPTGSLDRRSSSMVLQSLRWLASQGSCVILVTHDLQAAALADRALVLVDGSIIAQVAHPSPNALLRMLPAASEGVA